MSDTPTPAYGEPWKVGRIDRPMEDRHGHDPLMLHRTASRAVRCVNACAGMVDPAAEIAALRRDLGQARGERDRQKVKITAMRDAIREAHKIIQVLYMDALDHHKESWPRANEWMEKYAAFAKP